MSSVRTYIDSIKVLRKAGVVPMTWGPPGVGKTHGLIQAGMEISDEEFNTDYNGDVAKYRKDVRNRLMNRNYDDMFLVDVVQVPNVDPTDLMGVPNVVKDGDFHITRWARPDFMHWQGNGILFFDEATNGDTLTTQSLRSITFGRQVKNHYLGDGWFVSMAGNRTTDKSFSKAFPSPLITRVCHLSVACDVPNFKNTLNGVEDDIHPDIDESCEWFMNHNVRSEVVGYIKNRSAHIYHNQAVPRTWKFASDILTVLDKKGKLGLDKEDKLTDSVSVACLCGALGSEVAHSFMSHLRLKNEIPDIKKIFKDPKKAPMPDKLSIQHILCVELIYAAKQHEDVDKIMTYATRSDGMNPETQAFLTRGLINKEDTFVTCKKIADWANKHPDVMKAG